MARSEHAVLPQLREVPGRSGWSATTSPRRRSCATRTWDDPDSLSEINQAARQASLDYLERKLGDRPDLLAACTPHSPAMASRPVIDNGWLDAIRGPNVELVTDAIGRIVPEGIVTESGRVVEADAIVFATGFETSKFLWPMEVTGRHGTLHELWASDGARAYLGITMPGFPNLFCIYGPEHQLEPGHHPDDGLRAADPVRARSASRSCSAPAARRSS